jgi:hypothetical protein
VTRNSRLIPHKSNAMFALRGLARSRRQRSMIGSFLVMKRLYSGNGLIDLALG